MTYSDFEHGSDFSGVECKRQASRFPDLTNTDTEDWISASIIGKKKDEMGEKYVQSLKEYDEAGFRYIEPFSEYLSKENSKRYQQIEAEHQYNKDNDVKNGWRFSCEYCGHGIRHLFYIVNEKKKLIMAIGSHCIKNFENVDELSDLVRQLQEKTLREHFKSWRELTINKIWNTKKFYRKYSSKSLKTHPWKLQHDLGTTRRNNPSIEEVKKLFRRAKTMGFDIPEEVNDIISRTSLEIKKPED